MKKLCIFFVFTCLCIVDATAQRPAQQNSRMNQFITSLMNRMTNEEKIGQLNLPSIGFDVTGPILSTDVEGKIKRGLVGGVFNTFTPVAVRKLQQIAVTQTRLKIPLLFGYDVIHGHRTIFPIPLGLAATWDMQLIEQSARIAAIEATADGLNWVFSPMVDIARDPRWGRISEGAGEDPYLGSKIAQAMVRGYQGTDLSKNNTVLACVKHFALYGAGAAGRDYNPVDMSELQMYEYFLPPYKAAIDAGAATVMTSFNEINGVPATANKWLLTDLLRRQWGFDGMIVSDYTSVNEMVDHGIGDLKHVSGLAIKAGLDMDMVGEGFITHLGALLREGKISQADIDRACRKILEAKYKLGLFDDPYRYVSEQRAATEIFTPAHRQTAREIAARSLVLLKNSNNILPLRKNARIAVVGPHADNKRDMIGNWSGAGDWTKAVTVLEGLRANGTPEITYAKGANLVEDASLLAQLNQHGGNIKLDSNSISSMIGEAVNAARNADLIVAVLGETFGMSGEAASRSNLGIPENQMTLLRELVGTGKPVVLVLMSGRPLTIEWEAQNCAAILQTWFAGTEAGNAIADVLYGNYNPSGKLTATWPRNVGQIPIYYNHKKTGRPFRGNNLDKYQSRYLDVQNEPLFPFGYGLSYSNFLYSPVKLSKTTVRGNETLTASVAITNQGRFTADETVQLYITDPVASITRSIKDLRDFKKITLRPGEMKEVSFTVTTDKLKFYNANLKYDWEPGEFIIHIGTHSADVKSASVNWVK